MPSTAIHPTASDPYQPSEGRLPLYIGASIVLALDLSLWTVIGGAVWYSLEGLRG